jgi:hypothetical protein
MLCFEIVSEADFVRPEEAIADALSAGHAYQRRLGKPGLEHNCCDVKKGVRLNSSLK